MKILPEPISHDDAVSAIVFGIAMFAGLVLIVWEWLLR